MAEAASLFKPTETIGLWNSRYCAESKKGKCKRYAFYELNSCNSQGWVKIKAGQRVIVSINEM